MSRQLPDLNELLGSQSRNYVIDKHGNQTPIELLKGSIVGLYFSAGWCGPCRQFTPSLARIYTETKSDPNKKFEIVFISSDRTPNDFAAYFGTMPWKAIPHEERELQRALSDAFGIQGIPTLILIDEEGNLMTTDGRRAILRGYPFKEAPKAAAVVESSWVKGHSDLLPFIDRSKLGCLNQASNHTVDNIMNKDASYLESDADEQLLVTFGFNQTVKVHSIGIESCNNAYPSTIKLFINNANIDFSDAEALNPTQSFELSEDDWKEQKDAENENCVRAILPLKYVKFQKVHTLVIFIESNVQDEETTVVSRIRLFGSSAGDHTDMNNWSKEPSH